MQTDTNVQWATLVFVAMSLAAPCMAGAQTSLFVIRSEAADPVGAGLNLRLTDADGTVTTRTLADSIVSVSFVGAGHNLEYYFESPWGQAFRQGVFGKARRTWTTEFDEAGLHARLDGRLCDIDSAAFEVRDLTRDAAGAVVSLWLVFHQRCAGSSTMMSGEIRVSADTSVYIRAPVEVSRDVGEVVTFPVTAVDTRGLAVTLTPVLLPQGVTYTPSGAAGGEVGYAAVDGAGSVVRLSFAAASDDGAVDTVHTLVRTFAPAFLRMVSPPGDYLGQGLTYDLGPRNGIFSITRSGSAMRVRWVGRRNRWDVQLAAPYGRAPAVGHYGGEVPPSGPGPKTANISASTTGRVCSGFSTYSIRRVGFDEGGSVSSLWMAFALGCSGKPGTTGEVFFDADTSYQLEGPVDHFTDPDVPVSYVVRARGLLAPDVQWTLLRAPAGVVMVPIADAAVSLAWEHPIEPGDYPVTIVGSGAAGVDSLTTWIHVPRPSFMSIRILPIHFAPNGVDYRFLDRDGSLRYWKNPGNSISARFDGSGYSMNIDFSRAYGERIVPGEYPVTGSIPPWGTSLNGIYFVWNYLYPTPTTGMYRVYEARYDAADSLIALWLTWELGLVGLAEPMRGEIHMFGPDAPTPALVSLIEAAWSDGVNRLRWHAGAVGGAFTVERWAGSGGWTALESITPDGSGVVALDDAEVGRGQRYGYRLVEVAGGPPLGEAWIDVPAPAAFDLARLGPNPGPSPIRFSVSMPSHGSASLTLIDVSGRVIERRELNDLPEGASVVTLGHGPPLRSGCYFARLTSAGRTLTRTILVLR